MISVRLADRTDTDKIISFIKDNWSEDHIFVKHPEVFHYMHDNGSRIDYVIAIDEKDKIFGVCGFITCSSRKNTDIWLALWKVIPSGIPALGLNLIRFLNEQAGYGNISCCGIAPDVLPLYKYMGFTTGKMKHYYMLAPREDFRIAKVAEKKQHFASDNGAYKLKEINEKIFTAGYNKTEKTGRYIPYKDKGYIVHRFFKNPFYDYKVWSVCKPDDQSFDSVLVGREIALNDSKILRIVDFIGDEDKLSDLGDSFLKLLDDHEYEYIDFLEYGLADDTLTGLGFVLRTPDDENIIPNYFEPFELRNVDIYMATRQKDGFLMFKADGDQDRPSIL